MATSERGAPARRGGKRADGEGSLRQRKDGAWEARLMVGYLPSGKADQRSVYGKTQQECRRKLTALRQQAEQGTVGDRQTARRTVASFLATWLDGITPTVRASTALRYGQIIRLHLVPAIGARKLSELRPAHLQACYGALLAKGQAPASVRKAHVVLHRAFRDAVRWGDLPRNPCDAVDPPALAHAELRPAEPAEVYRLLETATAAGDDLAPPGRSPPTPGPGKGSSWASSGAISTWSAPP